ncbi:MAG: hypothetical protein DRP85_03130 [Candidatus Makaraimicrobium thalassicum]|nr:MAG: hypothetical protein DRP85_03130 [Candidatus Omnitrophota bacterium]
MEHSTSREPCIPESHLKLFLENNMETQEDVLTMEFTSRELFETMVTARNKLGRRARDLGIEEATFQTLDSMFNDIIDMSGERELELEDFLPPMMFMVAIMESIDMERVVVSMETEELELIHLVATSSVNAGGDTVH